MSVGALLPWGSHLQTESGPRLGSSVTASGDLISVMTPPRSILVRLPRVP